jgi:hypothetical protein
MAFDVRMPDGTIIRNVPEGTTQEEILSRYNASQQPAPQQQPVSMTERMFGAGSPTARFLKGAVVDPLLGANQLLAETGLFGETVKQQARGNVRAVEQAVQEGRKRVGSEGLDLVQLAGNIASPVNLLSPAAAAPTAVGRIAQAAGTGALFGGITPVADAENYVSEKVNQIGFGALAGALIGSGVESATKASKVIKGLSQPLTESGRREVLRDYLTKLSGPDREKVLTALKGADELVAGSRPTVAEAVSDIPTATGLAAYQRRLAGSMPEEGIAGQFAQRTAEQQAARTGALRQDVAQTPELLDLARTLRDADATRNYGQAFAQTITADPRLAQIASNPYFKDALPDAIKLAEAKGITAKTDLTEVLQYVKISLDKQLGKTGDTALSNAEKSAVRKVKQDLLGWVGKKNPQYSLARETFAKASQPINQMEIGQFLESKLGTALGDKERAGAFATAVQEAASTIKKSSGQAVGKRLEDVLTPKQTATVNNILADVSRKAKAEELASQSNIGSLIQDTAELPNLLNRYATITNTVLKALKKDSNAEINQLAAQMMLDPRQLAAFIEGVPKSKAKEVTAAILKRLSPENRELFIRATAYSKNELDMLSQAVSPATTGVLPRFTAIQGATQSGLQPEGQ